MRLFILILIVALAIGLLGPLFWVGATIVGLWIAGNVVYRLGKRHGKL